MPLVLKTTSIYKKYKDIEGEIEVLNGIDLEVNEGEIIVVFGPSGSGKTTLLNILGGIDPPDSGKVFIDEIDLYNCNEKELSKIRNKKIGFIFQFHQLLPEFTVIENIKIPALINGNNISDEECIKIINDVNLYGKENRFPNQLSGGEQQRVAVARSIINKPKIVLADEPTGNLDSYTSENLYKLFIQLKEKYNTTFIIATHNKEVLHNISDRAFKLERGKLHKL